MPSPDQAPPDADAPAYCTDTVRVTLPAGIRDVLVTRYSSGHIDVDVRPEPDTRVIWLPAGMHDGVTVEHHGYDGTADQRAERRP